MKRVLPLLSAAVVGFGIVAFGGGCDGNASYPYDDYGEEESCKSRTSKGACETDDDDDSTSPPVRTGPPVDPGVVTLATGQDVACMTVDVDAAYWVRRDGTIAALSTTDVPSTGRPTIAESAVRADVGSGSCELVRDGNYLWVTAFKDGVVRRLAVRKNADRTVSFAEGTLTFGGFGTPSSLAVDDAWVYVAEYDGGALRRFPKPPAEPIADAGPDAAIAPDAGSDAGAAIETLAVAGTQAGHIVLDEDSVYWLSYTSTDAASGVRRVAKTGGPVTTLAAGSIDLRRIGGSLYFFYDHMNEPRRVRTVSTRGGLATPIPDTDYASALTTDGTSLFVASGTGIVELGAERTRALFIYTLAAPKPAEITLAAQPGRLVWALGGDIATRVTR